LKEGALSKMSPIQQQAWRLYNSVVARSARSKLLAIGPSFEESSSGSHVHLGQVNLALSWSWKRYANEIFIKQIVCKSLKSNQNLQSFA
jgi:hypothetical protein